MGRRELIGIEEQLFAQYPALVERHAEAARAGAEKVRALVERRDAAGDTDAEAFAEHVALVQRTALAGYAVSVRGLVPVDDVTRWIRARDALKLSSYDAPLSEVDAPGAASLLDALEAVPQETVFDDQATLDQMLAAIADRCECGYARTRTLAKKTCYFCAEAVTAAWTAEERRVLTRLPGLRPEVDGLIDALVDRLAQLEIKRDGDTWSLIESELRRARRGLARLNRAARQEIFDEMLTSWRALASVAVRDHRPAARSVAKGWKRSGLGTARLSAVAVPGNDEVKARITQRAQMR